VSRDFDGFSLRTDYLHGFVGEWWLAPTFEVFGNSERVILIAASLQTAGGRYPGVIHSRTASAHPAVACLGVHWDFGRDKSSPQGSRGARRDRSRSCCGGSASEGADRIRADIVLLIAAGGPPNNSMQPTAFGRG